MKDETRVCIENSPEVKSGVNVAENVQKVNGVVFARLLGVNAAMMKRFNL